MIGYLKGRVIKIEDFKAIVDVNSVGYSVEIGSVGVAEEQEVQLYVHTYLRENELRLFGFLDFLELQLFEKLIGISGVGPKAALMLLRFVGWENIVHAISSGDENVLKVKGVGLKTAQKIIIELKNKIEEFEVKTVRNIHRSKEKKDDSIFVEAERALEGLGYTEREVQKIMGSLDRSDYKTTSEIIKDALKTLR